MATRAPNPHTVRIETVGGKVECVPKKLKPDGHVNHKDTITWECDASNWAVVFGPDAPFVDQVIGKGLKIEGREEGDPPRWAKPKTEVRAFRPGDFHKHKYVAIVWKDDMLVACDPEVDVDED
ncbi:MAG: hypothetical protein ACYSUQ_02560 [Planctomycetota bacterium]|jgi:hypothetical protein